MPWFIDYLNRLNGIHVAYFVQFYGFETIELNEVGNMDTIQPVKVVNKPRHRFLQSPFKGRKKKQRREESNSAEGGKMVRMRCQR